MRLAFLCQGKANPNGASRDEVVHPTGWYPASGINGPRNFLEKGSLTHREWEKSCVKLGGKVGDVGQELCFPVHPSHCPSKSSSGQTGKGLQDGRRHRNTFQGHSQARKWGGAALAQGKVNRTLWMLRIRCREGVSRDRNVGLGTAGRSFPHIFPLLGWLSLALPALCLTT